MASDIDGVLFVLYLGVRLPLFVVVLFLSFFTSFVLSFFFLSLIFCLLLFFLSSVFFLLFFLVVAVVDSKIQDLGGILSIFSVPSYYILLRERERERE